jgi:hypothetical protein
MDIHVNTDHHIHGHLEQAQEIKVVIEGALRRFAAQITRVDVHITDENANKGGAADKKCVIELRLSGLTPVVGTHHAPSAKLAVDGAVEKAKRAADSLLGRLHDR